MKLAKVERPRKGNGKINIQPDNTISQSFFLGAIVICSLGFICSSNCNSSCDQLYGSIFFNE